MKKNYKSGQKPCISYLNQADIDYFYLCKKGNQDQQNIHI